MPDLALYIHIPYCLEKCPYCDFHSIPVKRPEIPAKSYVGRLIEELRLSCEENSLFGKSLVAVFIGGGTPSLIAPEDYVPLFAAIREIFGDDLTREVTLEANPATVSIGRLCGYRDIGLNRLSIGVQSFQPRLLKKLGRNHSSKEAEEAIRFGLEAGFDNINCDLMFGIESQTLPELICDMETVLQFPLKHLSVYQLTVEANTPLHTAVKSGATVLPEEDMLLEMHKTVPDFLASRGLPRYEISNYSQKGLESRHNLQYWRYRSYLGIGSGAYSFLENRRWRTSRRLYDYLKGETAKEDLEIIDATTSLKEKWMMGLRLQEGMPFDAKTDNQTLGEFIRRKIGTGEMEEKKGRIGLTDFGTLWYNRIVAELFEFIDQSKGSP